MSESTSFQLLKEVKQVITRQRRKRFNLRRSFLWRCLFTFLSPQDALQQLGSHSDTSELNLKIRASKRHVASHARS